MTEPHSFVPFLSWLVDQKDRADPIGDIAREHLRDDNPDVPDDPAAFVQYVGHVGGGAAEEAAMKAAAEYIAWDQS